MVYEITKHSSFWVAMIVFIGLVPSTCLCPTFGGIIVDRFPIRRIMYITQTCGAVQALILAYVATHHPQLWHVIGCTLLGSLINSVDAPARHRLMIDIVPHEHIPSAQALNGVLITSGQVAGGALAGIVLVISKSYAGSFMLNALSFVAVLATLHMMKLHPAEEHTEAPLDMLKEGASYIMREKTVLLQLILVGIFAGVGFSYRGILPAIAREIYHAHSKEAITSIAGYVAAALAAGSVIGGLVVSAYSEKLALILKPLVLYGSLAMGIAWIVFPMVHTLAVGLSLMTVFGTGFAVCFSGIRSTVKQYVKTTNKDMLGRVIGFDFMFFFGGTAIGNLIIGNVADRLGISITIQLIGILMVVMSAFLYIVRSHLQAPVLAVASST
jgi:MFS family permease